MESAATKTMTPVEIDTKLAEIYGKESAALALKKEAKEILKGATKRYEEKKAKGSHMGYSNMEQMDEAFAKTHAAFTEKMAKADALVAECWAEAAPYEAEYKSRPWARYFLVANSNGHIHSSRHCSSCYATTRFVWMVEYADQSAEDTIYKHGTTVCTVCFPDAPVEATTPALVSNGKCSNRSTVPGSESDPRRMHRFGTCAHCGAKGVSITKNGYLRKHKAGPEA